MESDNNTGGSSDNSDSYSDTSDSEDTEKEYQIDRRKLPAAYQFAKASQYCLRAGVSHIKVNKKNRKRDSLNTTMSSVKRTLFRIVVTPVMVKAKFVAEAITT